MQKLALAHPAEEVVTHPSRACKSGARDIHLTDPLGSPFDYRNFTEHGSVATD
jgi:hypothetical protein